MTFFPEGERESGMCVTLTVTFLIKGLITCRFWLTDMSRVSRSHTYITNEEELKSIAKAKIRGFKKTKKKSWIQEIVANHWSYIWWTCWKTIQNQYRLYFTFTRDAMQNLRLINFKIEKLKYWNIQWTLNTFIFHLIANI